jgi:hypothetical protein
MYKVSLYHRAFGWFELTTLFHDYNYARMQIITLMQANPEITGSRIDSEIDKSEEGTNGNEQDRT